MTDAPEVPRPTKPPHAWAEPFFTFGVTGTNGKTSTSSLIASVLRAAGKRVLLETTLGYRLDDETLDVPRTLGGYVQAFEKAAQAGSKDAVVEVTSQALANGYARKWRFDLGVFTNLSRITWMPTAPSSTTWRARRSSSCTSARGARRC